MKRSSALKVKVKPGWDGMGFTVCLVSPQLKHVLIALRHFYRHEFLSFPFPPVFQPAR